MIYNKITPHKTRDLLFDQCETRNQITKKLTSLFEMRGYNQVMTPGLEFYDVFNSNARYFLPESMYKLTDLGGRLLVLRPDCTIPIARLTATKLANEPLPLRLFYSSTVYKNNKEMRSLSDEEFQTGIELIGASGKMADIEALELAAKSLELLGFEDFRLEICHIGIFKRLLELLNCTENEKEMIRECIADKNYAALSDILLNYSGNAHVKTMLELPMLFGGSEVIEQAKALVNDELLLGLLDDLSSTFNMLKKLGLESKVIVDLGLVNKADYYTGIIFRGYVEGAGTPVLSGGRYDNLMQNFGRALPATGFAINVDLVADTLLLSSKQARRRSDVIVFSEKEDVQAFAHISALNKAGLTAELSLLGSLEETVEYAKSAMIKRIDIIAEDIRRINL